MDKDKEESKRAGKLVRARRRECYYNSFRVIMNVPEFAKADYVEGIAVVGGLPIEHGWVERDGVVIDPTLPSKEAAYFPGLRFTGRVGLADAMQIPRPERTEEDFPIFYRFGWGGIDSPDFRTALIAAYRHAGMEAMAKRYEEYTPRTEDMIATAG